MKYWFSVSDEEQERRFQERIRNPRKRWKLSEMDLQSRARWVDYSRAKDRMFELTDTKLSPWWVDADDKRRARLNCIATCWGKSRTRRCCRRRWKSPSRQQEAGKSVGKVLTAVGAEVVLRSSVLTTVWQMTRRAMNGDTKQFEPKKSTVAFNVPDDVDVRSVRESLALTQAEFAARFLLSQSICSANGREEFANRMQPTAPISL